MSCESEAPLLLKKVEAVPSGPTKLKGPFGSLLPAAWNLTVVFAGVVAVQESVVQLGDDPAFRGGGECARERAEVGDVVEDVVTGDDVACIDLVGNIRPGAEHLTVFDVASVGNGGVRAQHLLARVDADDETGGWHEREARRAATTADVERGAAGR